MQSAIQALPTHDTTRRDLVAETYRLALAVERAERGGDSAGEARQRVAYHIAMGELLARTTAVDDSAQRRIEQERAYHEARARAFQRELGQLGGGE